MNKMCDFSNMIIDIFSIISNKVEYEIILIQINDKPFFVLTKEETSLCFVIICFYLSGAIFILSTLPFHPLRSPYSSAKCDDLSISTVCDVYRLVFIRIYFSVVQLQSAVTVFLPCFSCQMVFSYRRSRVVFVFFIKTFSPIRRVESTKLRNINEIPLFTF